MNISRASVVNIEKGRQNIPIQKLIALGKITGFNLTSLLNDKGEDLPKRSDYKLSEEIHDQIDEIPLDVVKGFILLYKKIKPNVL